MEFRLLGPLEVRGEDGPLPLGGAKQRALLALLLLNANRVVPVDLIVDQLWGDEPPDTATTAIQVHVSRLRKVLPAGRLETRAPGYLLHVEHDELDLDRFERLRTAGALQEALELWRGPPVAELPRERARLEELRFAVLEERLEADLERGRHAELVGELELLIGAEPHREGLRALLMTALYRSGRQAEALAAYRDARVALDELGIEPGRVLQELERAILVQDPVLDPDRERLTLPRERLPSPAHPLVGRGSEVRELKDLLLGDARLVTITGAAGSGKTRLAMDVARGLVDSFDHAIFIELAPLAEPELVASTVAGALNVSGTSARPIDETIAAHIGGVRMLLVLDNAEHVLEGTRFLARLLEHCAGLALLVTSRAPLHLGAEHQYPLDPLSREAAAELFRARADAVDPGFAAPDETVAAICDLLDDLPLALELAAVHVKVLSSTDLLKRLDDRFELLTSAPRDAPDRQRTLRSAIEWSYALLPDDSQELLARLSVFAGTCTYESAKAVSGASLDLLGSLLDASLLRRRVDSGVARFWMLETIRAYALEQLVSSEFESATRRAHATYFVDFAEEAAAQLSGHEQQGFLKALDADIDNLRGALAWSQVEEPGLTLRLAAALGRYWATRGLFPEARHWLDSVATLPSWTRQPVRAR